MTEKIILYSIIGIAVSITLSFLSKSTGKKITSDNKGFINLRINKLYGIIGSLSMFLGLALLLFLLLTTEKVDITTISILTLMLAFFWGAGIPCILYYKNHRLTYDNSIIKVINVYGNQKSINWKDIKNIKFNAISGLLIISDNNNQVKIHQHFVGLSNFTRLVEKKTKWTIKELKIPVAK